MADNDFALQNGTEKISTVALVTVNGTSVTADVIEAPRILNMFGAGGNVRDVSKQFPYPVDTDSRRTISFRGNCSTFRIPGRAGTTGQKLFSLHNATGSTILVDIEEVSVDHTQTAVTAVTVLPPMVRLYKVTVLPTNGTAVTKVATDSTKTSSTSLTILQDASADGTSSATALTATLPAGAVIAGQFAPRLITAAGYEMQHITELVGNSDEKTTLRPLEGIVVMLDYTLATQNPVTNMWTVSASWTEYTAAA